jgi:thiol-disulfide isomerase/thioredoxin
MRHVVVPLLFAALAGCTNPDKPQVRADPSSSASAPTVRKLIFMHAPLGTVPAVVHDAVVKERANGRKLLVYVGAVWCEPCQRFHTAAAAGDLDATFPDVTMLEFDLDADKVRLEEAGYHMTYIPYFGVPNEDGTPSGQGINGSVKGPGAVQDIVPRLQALLGR